MAPFLMVLPIKIQIAVLQTWIAHPADDKVLLKALTRLDIACCAKALRQPFLTVVGKRWQARAGNMTCLTATSLVGYLD